ncbi:MAG TPA: ECF-type sigma factor [Bryobacteraceae bacterium]|nr:ECF-type sigma factor [Bryobacteraceae bacterium]
MKETGDITLILKRWATDRPAVLEELTPVVYQELRRIAAAYLRRERENYTLQPTALVNEAYLRLVKQDNASLENRSHFYGVAARVMRQILVDLARSRRAAKRGSGKKVALDEKIALPDSGGCIDFLALHEALDQLGKQSARTAQVVELRYFGGLQLEEIAVHLNISLATVKRDQAVGEAWLRRALQRA